MFLSPGRHESSCQTAPAAPEPSQPTLSELTVMGPLGKSKLLTQGAGDRAGPEREWGLQSSGMHSQTWQGFRAASPSLWEEVED